MRASSWQARRRTIAGTARSSWWRRRDSRWCHRMIIPGSWRVGDVGLEIAEDMLRRRHSARARRRRWRERGNGGSGRCAHRTRESSASRASSAEAEARARGGRPCVPRRRADSPDGLSPLRWARCPSRITWRSSTTITVTTCAAGAMRAVRPDEARAEPSGAITVAALPEGLVTSSGRTVAVLTGETSSGAASRQLLAD